MSYHCIEAFIIPHIIRTTYHEMSILLSIVISYTFKCMYVSSKFIFTSSSHYNTKPTTIVIKCSFITTCYWKTSHTRLMATMQTRRYPCVLVCMYIFIETMKEKFLMRAWRAANKHMHTRDYYYFTFYIPIQVKIHFLD